jgi:hypothetical protein
MKLRHLLFAASVMTFASLTSAQTFTASPSVKVDTNTPAYTDPIVQKRHADRVAKADYTAAKTAAKRKMNEEKSVAKSEMKADKKQASATMKDALATPSTKSDNVQ